MKASINGIDIAYDDHGIGIPVLFLHAFPLHKSMWTGQINALLGEQCYRLVALDWPGFGASPLVGGVLTMNILADNVAGLMDVLGMEQAVLCGLSMGGYVAFAFLRKYPQRVQGLILADTRPGADTDEAKANRERVALLALSEGTRAIADLQVPKLLSDYTRRHHPDVEQTVRRMIDVATPQGIAAVSRGMALRTDSTDLLSSISCPTLVIVGEEDVLTPPAVAHEYAAGIAGSQFATIPDAGHLSNLEQPEAFLAIVRNFLLASF